MKQEQIYSFTPVAGERYRHYKGGFFEIICIATEEKTLDQAAVYKSVCSGTYRVQSLASFTGTIKTSKGNEFPRFAKINL